MSYSLNSTLLLTILLFIGLFFFLKASSKDRTTTVEVTSSKKPVEVLNLLCNWLKLRGWKQSGGDTERKTLIFQGKVIFSKFLAIFLSILGGLGSCSLGLIIVQLYPNLHWWPILLGVIGGPLSGIIYSKKSSSYQEEKLFILMVIKIMQKKFSIHLVLKVFLSIFLT